MQYKHNIEHAYRQRGTRILKINTKHVYELLFRLCRVESNFSAPQKEEQKKVIFSFHAWPLALAYFSHLCQCARTRTSIVLEFVSSPFGGVSYFFLAGRDVTSTCMHRPSSRFNLSSLLREDTRKCESSRVVCVHAKQIPALLGRRTAFSFCAFSTRSLQLERTHSLCIKYTPCERTLLLCIFYFPSRAAGWKKALRRAPLSLAFKDEKWQNAHPAPLNTNNAPTQYR